MSDDELFREVDEEVRRDRFEILLKKYGTYVAAAVLVILGVTVGSVFWLQFQERKQLAASERFSAATQLVAEEELEQAVDEFSSLAESGGAGYRVLAGLRQAALLIELGDNEEAIALYDEIAEDGAVDQVYRDLASLLSVTHQVDDGDPAALTERLGDLTGDGNPWRFSARELTGVLAIRAGDATQAREAFEGLSADLDAPPGIRARAAELLAALDE